MLKSGNAFKVTHFLLHKTNITKLTESVSCFKECRHTSVQLAFRFI